MDWNLAALTVKQQTGNYWTYKRRTVKHSTIV